MLTNAVAKAAAPQARAYKLHDTGGLFLFVAPTGLKSWRLKYRWRRREKLLTFGRFPEVNLAQARMHACSAKAKLGEGIDPAGKVEIQVNTFELLARAWHAHNLNDWSAAHATDAITSLERDVFPAIGAREPGSIAPRELLAILREVEGRGCMVTAHRIRQRLSDIFAFGVAEGLVETDPAEKLGAAMKDPPPATPQAALVAIEDCRALLAACDKAAARPSTVLASRFLALTAVRLDAVRGMRWEEVQGLGASAPIWCVPPARMKLKKAKKAQARFAHVVPLSAAAVAVLRQAANNGRVSGDPAADSPVGPKNGGFAWPSSGLVFPGRGKKRPIGEGTIGALYVRAGFGGRHVPHGWRSSFSTILNELLGEGWSLTIDRALGHSPEDKVEAAYNRAELLERRRAIFDQWAELLSPTAR